MFPRPSSPISAFQILTLLALQLFCVSAFPPSALAWGQNGHRITAEIACTGKVACPFAPADAATIACVVSSYLAREVSNCQ